MQLANFAIRGLYTICMLYVAITANRIEGSEPIPHSRAHAHNDYEHKRPLVDALEQGFCSVEADIYLIDGALLVAHDRSDIRPDRSLESLYLDPLLRRVKENSGSVYSRPAEFMLLIDIKSNAEATYPVLAKVLSKYSEMLTEFTGSEVKKRAVTIVVSGNRPFELLRGESTRLAGLDGRLSDLHSKIPATLMPLISDRWSSHFTWNGEGTLPIAEQEKLAEIVNSAHANGQRVRFWATPETEAMWQALLDAQVDHINTDQLERLSVFLGTADRQ